MRCEKCGSKTTTIDTQPYGRGAHPDRRTRKAVQVMAATVLETVKPGKAGFRVRVHRCRDCGHELTTVELTERQFLRGRKT